MGSDSGFELSSVPSALTDLWSKYRKASSVAYSKPPAQLSGQTLTVPKFMGPSRVYCA